MCQKMNVGSESEAEFIVSRFACEPRVNGLQASRLTNPEHEASGAFVYMPDFAGNDSR